MSRITRFALPALALLALLLARPATAQTSDPTSPAGSSPAQPAMTVATQPGASGDCNPLPCAEAPQQIAEATPDSETSAPWPMRERIAWVARLLLVIIGYAAIMLGSSMMRKIERQSQATEQAAAAAAQSAQAAAQSAEAALDSTHALLLHAQKLFHAERPWVLVTVAQEPPGAITISASNRGRSPARIVSSIGGILLAAGEDSLPQVPDYTQAGPAGPNTPFVLLPGESVALRTFRRGDVEALCDTEDLYQRIDRRQESIFLCGRVLYEDLSAPSPDEALESGWCCQYFPGPETGSMTMIGRREYNRHT